MNKILTEKQYQRYIIDKLTNSSVGYIERTNADYNRYFAMDTALLLQFLEDTQPEEVTTLKKIYKAALQIRDLMKKNPDLIASAKSNTVNEFEYSYFTGVDEALLDGLQQNQEFFSLLLNDEALKKEVLGIFIKSIYDDLKRDNT